MSLPLPLRWPPLLLALAIGATAWVGGAHAAPGDSGWEREAGALPVRYYSALDYGAHPQNWATVQDTSGAIVVANTMGVLVHDGETWSSTVQVRNRSAARSLALGPDGRVYVGAEGDFGFLDRDAFGRTTYVSLIDEVPEGERAFTEVWKAAATSEAVYFLTNERLFAWCNGKIRSWAGPFSSFGLHTVGDRVFAQREAGDLMELARGSFKHLPGLSALGSSTVVGMLPDTPADGTGGPTSALLIVARERLWRYEGGTLTPQVTEADALLRESESYHAAALTGGAFALATLNKGVIVMGNRGRLLRHYDGSSGLPTDVVLGVMGDRQGGLWLALENGLTRIDLDVPHTVFGNAEGVHGLAGDVARFRGALYLVNERHLLRLTPREGRSAAFEPVTPTPIDPWSLHATRAGLLVGTREGLRVWDGRQLEPVTGAERCGYPTFVASERDPELVYSVGECGIRRVRYHDGVWTADAAWDVEPIGVISGFVAADGSLWLGTAYRGVWHVTPGDPVQLQQYGPREGLPDTWVQVMPFEGRPLFVTAEGLYRPEQARAVPDSSGLAAAFGYRPVELEPARFDAGGNLWAKWNGRVGVARRQADGSYHWETVTVQAVSQPSTQLIWPLTDAVWVVQPDRLVRYVPEDPTPAAGDFEVLIRHVEVGGEAQPLTDAGMTVPYGANPVALSFAATSYAGQTPTHYRYWLEGVDGHWSPWGTATQVSYTNLAPGRYVFRVEARNALGFDRAAVFVLLVPAPWYRSAWAVLLLALLLPALAGRGAWAFAKWRSRRLAAHARALEDEVASRVREVAQQATRLEALNADLERANRELRTISEQKSDLLGIAAHDLKSPLSNIFSIAEILQDELPPDAPNRDLIEIIERDTQRMVRLIEDLLQTAAAESGRIQVERGVLDLGELAEEVVRHQRPRAEEKQQPFLFRRGTVSPIEGDSQLLREAITNLVSNAIKYSPRGCPVMVEVAAVGGEVRVHVTDQGPGLTDHDKERLFQPFQRLSARPTAGESSSGLGLYIVRQYAHLHGGRVDVDSTPGIGSTFTLAFPAKGAPVRPARALSEPVAMG